MLAQTSPYALAQAQVGMKGKTKGYRRGDCERGGNDVRPQGSQLNLVVIREQQAG